MYTVYKFFYNRWHITFNKFVTCLINKSMVESENEWPAID